MKHFFGKLRELTRKRSQALADVQSYLHERVAGVSVIKSFALEEKEQKLFDETNANFLEKAIDHTSWNAKAFAVVNTITDVAPLLVILMRATKSSMEICQSVRWSRLLPISIVYIIHFAGLSIPLHHLPNRLHRWIGYSNLMEEKYDITDKKDAIALPPIQGKIEFDQVSFSYEKEGEDDIEQHQSDGETRGNCRLCRDERWREIDDYQSDSTIL